MPSNKQAEQSQVMKLIKVVHCFSGLHSPRDWIYNVVAWCHWSVLCITLDSSQIRDSISLPTISFFWEEAETHLEKFYLSLCKSQRLSKLSESSIFWPLYPEVLNSSGDNTVQRLKITNLSRQLRRKPPSQNPTQDNDAEDTALYLNGGNKCLKERSRQKSQ